MIKLSLYFGLWLVWCCNATDFGGRIIGGRESQPEDAFCVTIRSYVAFGDSTAYLSSGVAISPTIVLGTAQAVQSFAENKLVVYTYHVIGFDNIVVDEQSRSRAHATAHPSYNPPTLEFNIATFRLVVGRITSIAPFIETTPMPFVIKVLGYGAPDAITSFSSELLTTIGSTSTNCTAVLNSLVYGETNQCLRTEFSLAQGDQGGAVSNSWLTPDQATVFGIVSYWTRSEPNIVVMTNFQHPNISEFIAQQMGESKLT